MWVETPWQDRKCISGLSPLRQEAPYLSDVELEGRYQGFDFHVLDEEVPSDFHPAPFSISSHYASKTWRDMLLQFWGTTTPIVKELLYSQPIRVAYMPKIKEALPIWRFDNPQLAWRYFASETNDSLAWQMSAVRKTSPTL